MMESRMIDDLLILKTGSEIYADDTALFGRSEQIGVLFSPCHEL